VTDDRSSCHASDQGFASSDGKACSHKHDNKGNDDHRQVSNNGNQGVNIDIHVSGPGASNANVTVSKGNGVTALFDRAKTAVQHQVEQKISSKDHR